MESEEHERLRVLRTKRSGVYCDSTGPSALLVGKEPRTSYFADRRPLFLADVKRNRTLLRLKAAVLKDGKVWVSYDYFKLTPLSKKLIIQKPSAII